MRLRLFDFLYPVLGSVLFLVLFHNVASPHSFGYDESDYMTSARLGFAANYLDTTAMSFPEYFQAGLKTLRKQWSRTEISRYVRERNDSMFLRHYHGPVDAYYLIAAGFLHGSGESWMRLSSLFFHVLTFVTVYAGALWVFGPHFRIAAVAASACYLFCVNNITTIVESSPHSPFLWLSLATLFAISKFACDPRRGRFYWAIALCSLSLCTLEYAALLFVVLAATVSAVRHDFFAGWTKADFYRLGRNTALLAAGVCVVVWPSSLFKLAIVRGFAMIVFLAATRQGAYGEASTLEVWRVRFSQFPADMAAFSLSIAATVVLLRRSRFRRELLPFLLYGTLLAVTTFKNRTEAGRYISSMFAPFYITAAVLVAEQSKRIATWVQCAAVTAVFAVLLLVSRTEALARTAPARSDDTAELVGIVRRHAGERLLIPMGFVPAVGYYAPDAHPGSYPPDANASAVIRTAGAYDGVCMSWPPTSGWARTEALSSGAMTCYFRK